MRLISPFVVVAAITQLGASECGVPPIIKDPGFELWCGEELCSWKVVRGGVAQAPTWHKEDTGVELVGSDVAISQLSGITSGDVTCIQFEFVANVDEDAEAYLELDISGDGTIDHVERVPTARWKPLSYKLKLKPPYSGIRFVLSKRGKGKVVFAQIAAARALDCAGINYISTLPAPLGAPCSFDVPCQSGMCAQLPRPDALLGYETICVGCTADSCAAGEVCGLGEPLSQVLEVPRTCVAPGLRELAEQCVNDAECATGICTGGSCSTCRTACGTEECAPSYAQGPSVCSPGRHVRTSGEPCAIDDDCASDRCVGTPREQCLDGRACDGREDCPLDSDLEPGACSAVGIQGGRCQ